MSLIGEKVTGKYIVDDDTMGGLYLKKRLVPRRTFLQKNDFGEY